MVTSFFSLYVAKKFHKNGTAQVDLMKNYKSTLLLLHSSSARSSTCKDKGFSI